MLGLKLNHVSKRGPRCYVMVHSILFILINTQHINVPEDWVYDHIIAVLVVSYFSEHQLYCQQTRTIA